MQQTSMEPLWRGIEAEAGARERLQAQQLGDLRKALEASGVFEHTAAWRLAHLVFHVTKNTGGGLEWTAARIAADPSMASDSGRLPSERTISAAATQLRRLGVLDQRDEVLRGKCRPVRSIDWSGVRGILAPPPEGSQKGAQIPSQKGSQKGAQIPSQKGSQKGAQNRPYTDLPFSYDPDPSSSKEWVAVGEELVRLGVSGGTSAELLSQLPSAAELGRVEAILGQYRGGGGRWGPGALVRRLRTLLALPNLPAQEGWDQPRQAVATAEVAKRRRQATAADHQSATAVAVADRLEAERLEARHGATLDGMGAAERDALAAAVLCGFAAHRYRTTWQRPGSAARRQLLESLDREA